MQGACAEATDALEHVDELTVDLSDLQFRGGFYVLRAELALEEGRSGDAYGDVELALAQATGTDDQAMTCQICTLGAPDIADQREEARRRRLRFDEHEASLLAADLTDKARMLVDLPRQCGTQPVPRAEAFALQCRAEPLGCRCSMPPRGSSPPRDGSDSASGTTPHIAACAKQKHSSRRGGPGRAAKVLLGAWRTTAEMGATPLQAKAEALAERARVSLDAETPRARRVSQVAHDLGLTSREVEVLGYLASGKTDGQIAEALFISKKTASVHVSNLLRKLDVESRYAAAEIGREHELFADSPLASA